MRVDFLAVQENQFYYFFFKISSYVNIQNSFKSTINFVYLCYFMKFYEKLQINLKFFYKKDFKIFNLAIFEQLKRNKNRNLLFLLDSNKYNESNSVSAR